MSKSENPTEPKQEQEKDQDKETFQADRFRNRTVKEIAFRMPSCWQFCCVPEVAK